MIDLKKLSDKDIGKWVWYVTPHGDVEIGKLKCWNDKFVFVVYKCAGEWYRFKDYTGNATNPKDLEFIK